MLVVLSPQTVNSPWVRREVHKALEVEKQGGTDGYRVIPLLLPGLTVGALGNWFDEEPVAVPIQLTPGGLSVAMPAILAALGERLPTDHQPLQTTAKQTAGRTAAQAERSGHHHCRRQATRHGDSNAGL